MKVKKRKKRDRQLFFSKEPICPVCKCKGKHYVPPSLREPGYYICKEYNKLNE